MRILELCLSPDLGGLELYVKRLSSFLDKNHSVINVIDENAKLKNEFEKANLKYLTLKRSSSLQSFFLAFKLARIIDQNNIEIIHIHWTKDILISVVAKLLSHTKPRIVQSRHMRMTRFKDDFYHKFLYKNIDLIIAVTDQVKEQLEKFIPQNIRLRVIRSYIGASQPNMIDSSTSEKLKQLYKIENSFVVGIVGRIEEAKGQFLLLDAIKELKERGLNVKALIIGSAMSEEYLYSLQERVKNESLSEDVIFTGFVSNVQELMQVCDTIILATKNETFGLVLIEAMRAKITVIGSDLGGPLEIIDDGKNGLLFESFNAKNLSKKIEILYNDSALKERLAISGKTKADEKFDDIKQFEEIEKILESIL